MTLTVIEQAKVHSDGSVQGRANLYAYSPGEGNGNLLSALRDLGIDIAASCGGNGKCGKCKVFFTEKAPEILPTEREKLSSEELALGYRLACLHDVTEGMVIAIPVRNEATQMPLAEEGMQILGAGFRGEKQAITGEDDKQSYNICIDLGTTTIAAALQKGDQVIDSVSVINHQKSFGADVISRIKASVEGNGEKLRTLVQQDIRECMERLLQRQHISMEEVRQVILAGNTTMLHLLNGYSCEGLGAEPFKPVRLTLEKKNLRDVFGEDMPEMVLLPGISAFVGADIASGLFAIHMEEQEEPVLLVDLGTNGEMVLGKKDSLYVTSTAAGPAFEGGNLSCGVPSIPGAISHVGEEGITTIGNKTPIGLCGTGVIDALAYMLKKGIMDANGLLKEEYFEKGYSVTGHFGPQIRITQEDIRQVQLAKAAIRAGIEILSKRSGISFEKVKTLELAGGFGFYLDPANAIAIGMLPEAFAGKVHAAGNTSLNGCLRLGSAKDHSKEEQMEQILTEMTGKAREISLAGEKEFEELFLTYMAFGKN